MLSQQILSKITNCGTGIGLRYCLPSWLKAWFVRFLTFSMFKVIVSPFSAERNGSKYIFQHFFQLQSNFIPLSVRNVCSTIFCFAKFLQEGKFPVCWSEARYHSRLFCASLIILSWHPISMEKYDLFLRSTLALRAVTETRYVPRVTPR